MTIKAEARYFNNAHRISDYILDSSVTELRDGQWLQFKTGAPGVLEIAAGTKAAFLTTSAKWGNSIGPAINATIHQGPFGKDTVTPDEGKVVILAGPYRLATDQFDGTVPLANFVVGGDLTINGTGQLKPAGATDRVFATCVIPPASASDFITVVVC